MKKRVFKFSKHTYQSTAEPKGSGISLFFLLKTLFFTEDLLVVLPPGPVPLNNKFTFNLDPTSPSAKPANRADWRFDTARRIKTLMLP